MPNTAYTPWVDALTLREIVLGNIVYAEKRQAKSSNIDEIVGMSTVSGKYLQRTPVFIASPGDLSAERGLFPDVIERVNRIKAKSKGILLEAVG